MNRPIALVLACAALIACGDDDGSSPALDASVVSDAATPDAAVPDCYPNPTTHFELINACTDAEKLTKTPVLPLLLADGGLPPLP